MNARKFCLTMSAILLVFLFGSGFFLLNYISSDAAVSNPLFNQNGFIADWIKDIQPQTDPVNVLVLGGDKVAGNTDTMMLVNFNPSTTQISVLSVPRDTMVSINGHRQKINAAYPFGGSELCMDVLKNLLGVKIDYFVYIDTTVFREVIDILDGVEYDVPVDMKYDDPAQNLHINLKKGYQTLDGDKAEQFMRFRKPNYGAYSNGMSDYYDGSDLKRISAQQNFIKEVIRQKANVRYIPKVNSIVDTLLKKVETDITANEVLRLSESITNIDYEKIQSFRLGGTDAWVSGISYYVYTDEVLNTATNEKTDAETILETYFGLEPGEYENFSDKYSSIYDNNDNKSSNTSSKGNKSNPPKKNPSNSGTKVKPQTDPLP